MRCLHQRIAHPIESPPRRAAARGRAVRDGATRSPAPASPIAAQLQLNCSCRGCGPPRSRYRCTHQQVCWLAITSNPAAKAHLARWPCGRTLLLLLRMRQPNCGRQGPAPRGSKSYARRRIERAAARGARGGRLAHGRGARPPAQTGRHSARAARPPQLAAGGYVQLVKKLCAYRSCQIVAPSHRTRA